MDERDDEARIRKKIMGITHDGGNDLEVKFIDRGMMTEMDTRMKFGGEVLDEVPAEVPADGLTRDRGQGRGGESGPWMTVVGGSVARLRIIGIEKENGIVMGMRRDGE